MICLFCRQPTPSHTERCRYYKPRPPLGETPTEPFTPGQRVTTRSTPRRYGRVVELYHRLYVVWEGHTMATPLPSEDVQSENDLNE